MQHSSSTNSCQHVQKRSLSLPDLSGADFVSERDRVDFFERRVAAAPPVLRCQEISVGCQTHPGVANHHNPLPNHRHLGRRKKTNPTLAQHNCYHYMKMRRMVKSNADINKTIQNMRKCSVEHLLTIQFMFIA